jgi:hypothetical protein
LVKRIQVWSNKGPGPVQRGDNHRYVRKWWGHLKILFLRNIWSKESWILLESILT